MSELVITSAGFVLQPVANLRNGPAVLRWAYNRSFLDSNGVQVFAGTQNKGFAIEVPCSIADGLISVDGDSTLWATDDAQDPSPASIWISAWLLTPRGGLIAPLTVVGKTQLVVPSPLAPTTTWSLFSNYNQAVTLAYLNPNYYTAAQIDRLVRQWMDNNAASDLRLGTVLLTVPADIPASPVVWGANDPLVRDAIKIQSVDVSTTPPLDSQALIYNQANNQWEPANQASGTGNVISNEVSSIDGQVATASGTGGKTITFSVLSGLLKAASGVLAAAVAAVDYVAPGLITASGLTQTTGKLLGRSTAATGAVEEISVGTGLSLSAGVLSNTVPDTGITQLTGDVTAGPGSGSQAATIPNDTVTFAKMQNITTDSLIGRDTAATGDPENILLNATLSMDGAGNLQRAALTGDVTASAGSNTTAIGSHAVTYGKMQQVSAISKLLGRGDSGAPGDVQEITLGTNLSMTGATLNASAGTGTVGNIGTLTSNQLIIGQGGTDIAALGSLGTATTVLHGNAGGAPTFGAVALTTDVSGDLPFANLTPASAASKLLGRGSASGAGDYEEITIGSGLTMTGTTLSASAGGTVTTVSVSSANGFAGSVANPTTTPAITISTTVTGLLKGNGTAVSAAIAGTDYVSPTATTVDATGAPLTLDATHNGKIVLVDNDVTIPTGLGAGFNCLVVQASASAITFIASGTTLNSFGGSLDTAGQWAGVSVAATASNVFLLVGGLA
jgi:hypothetical protein